MATCMIVDDEPLSRDILRKFISEVKTLELVAECPDAFEATHQLGQKQVDILFLDINMPGLTGISMARSLTHAPLIVFTTAYPRFAVEGFELDAIDYLVKPYSFERFLKSVNRAMERLSNGNNLESSPRRIMVKADKKLYAVETDRILYIEGQGDYIRIHMDQMRLVVHDTLKGFMESLPGEDFMRIHKSFVVNLKRIGFIEGNQVRINAESIPVSPVYKEELLDRYSTP
ncbi:MAG: response regulator transcription factor [Syntrophobacterales bacterium]|nr:MAG: response regulator transcription factor [Syntrophobacterales bacterium]